jgi:predicted  nucleic acid-binding Zn-ribbon protein
LSNAAAPSPLAYAPISIGELVDKITILEIKAQRVRDPHKRDAVSKELTLLNEIDCAMGERGLTIKVLKDELRQVNEALWDIEDRIRDCEREQSFGEEFIALARAVYKTNDRRAELKRRINEILGSPLMEVKSHAVY